MGTLVNPVSVFSQNWAVAPDELLLAVADQRKEGRQGWSAALASAGAGARMIEVIFFFFGGIIRRPQAPDRAKKPETKAKM
jgi:hypothetical protein